MNRSRSGVPCPGPLAVEVWQYSSHPTGCHPAQAGASPERISERGKCGDVECPVHTPCGWRGVSGWAPACGAYGHNWFIDPVNKLTVLALTNTALEGMWGQFKGDIREAVYDEFGP